MGKFKDLTNQKFGRLKVIRLDEERMKQRQLDNQPKLTYWLCKCDCGNPELISVLTSSLNSGNTMSCGCYKSIIIKKNNKISKKKYNTYDLTGEYGIGYDSKGREFYFDLEDYDKIKDYCWYIDSNGYVVCSADYGYKKIMFHRLIMNCDDNNLVIDHINGCDSRNNNKKCNLRICTPQQNSLNRQIQSNNTSGCTGVYYSQGTNKWIACIEFKGENINLGSFISKEDAIKIREKAEVKYFGEYRYVNKEEY